MLSVPSVVTINGTFNIAIETPFKTPRKVPIMQDRIIKNILDVPKTSAEEIVKLASGE